MKNRILITDDDRCLLNAYRALLAPDPELVLDLASGPAQAHALMAKHHYDAALFDIELSADEDGVELMQGFRRAHPGTPVLLMSTRDDERTVSRCLAAGATAFASKNRDFLPGFTARVHRLLSRRTRARCS